MSPERDDCDIGDGMASRPFRTHRLDHHLWSPSSAIPSGHFASCSSVTIVARHTSHR